MGNGSPSWLPASRNATATHTFAANAQKVIERYPFNEQSGYFGERGSRGDVRRYRVRQSHQAGARFLLACRRGWASERLAGRQRLARRPEGRNGRHAARHFVRRLAIHAARHLARV